MKTPIIAQENLYLVTDVTGYSPNIGRLICMMNYVRQVTLHSVKDLTVKELDYLFDEESNSIGALLLHFAATDFYYQRYSFEERDLNEEETKEWLTPLDLGDLGRKEIKGHDLEFYINKLDEVRSRTYELLKEKDDEWLERKVPYGKSESNNYHLWFHVFEDEINHRGQINWLKKRFKKLLTDSL